MIKLRARQSEPDIMSKVRRPAFLLSTCAMNLVEKLGEAGIDPNDIIVFFLEIDRASGSFGGGRRAPPIAFD
jgi:hypothetical protein